MPRQLPGLYWDDDKQRYFPLHRSRSPPRALTTQHDGDSLTLKRRRTCYDALSHLRFVLGTTSKDDLLHQIRSSQVLLTDTFTRSPIPCQAQISAFQTVSHAGQVSNFVGDTLGWFYSSIVDPTTDPWQQRFHLSSEVTSIAIAGSHCLATSFGPDCRILYLPLDSPLQGMCISRFDSRSVHDVWTSDLQQSRLVLGAYQQAVLIDDVALCGSFKRLSTQSDVFALAQRENTLYTGLRNGGILRFDTRMPTSSKYPLFHSDIQRTGSITGLKHLRDYQLLASVIDGGISTFDLRFPIQTPLMTFTGHFNSYTVKLPLVTDPDEKLLFAAGQDNQVRMWSLMTGGPALHPGGTDSTDQAVFQRPFEHRVAALQVVEEREGLRLWVASGTELYKYSLGHHLGMGDTAPPREI